jgi:predicted  nucleic acid-binding Zn-ribbon protein/DNA-binding phage protein
MSKLALNGITQSVKILLLVTASTQVQSQVVNRDVSVTAAQEAVIKKGVQFGLAYGDLITSATLGAIPKEYPRDASGDIQSMVSSYNSEVRTNTAAVRLLDTTLDIALVASTIGGSFAPPVLLVAATANYAKNQAMDFLYADVTKNAQIILKNNIDTFLSASNMSYESLQGQSIDQIKIAIDKAPFLEDGLNLATDPKSKEIFKAAIARSIRDTQKSTLDQIQYTQDQLKNANKNIANVSKALGKFQEETAKSLDTLASQVDSIEQTQHESADLLKSLHSETKNNSRDLKLIGEIMFKNASTEDKLSLLNGSWNPDLTQVSREKLVKYYLAEQKREQFMSSAGQAIDAANKIGQIAKNLGISSPELSTAISYGDTAYKTAGALMKGDYLGALMSVTGLFGGAEDAGAAQHKAMMSFLKQEFKQINVKLDQLLEGQQKIMKQIAAVSEQIQVLRNEVNDRFNIVDYKLDALHELTWAMYAAPLVTCKQIQTTTRQKLSTANVKKPADFEFDNLYSFTNLELLQGTFTDASISKCLDFLSPLFYTVTQFPDKLTPNPLGVRLSGTVPADNLSIESSKITVFKDASKIYTDNFSNIFNWVSETPTVEGRYVYGHSLLAALATPTRKLSTTKKVGESVFTTAVCVKQTTLGSVLFEAICGKASGYSFSTPDSDLVPRQRDSAVEQAASDLGYALLGTPLVQEDISKLAELQLYFAPLYDIRKTDSTYAFDRKEILDSAAVLGRGKSELQSALSAILLSVAQINMLYGDQTSRMIAESLWDEKAKRFATKTELDKLEPTHRMRRAVSFIAGSQSEQSGQTYLAQNTLMTMLDRLSTSAQPYGTGERLNYSNALEALLKLTIEPDALMRTLFGIDQNNDSVKFIKSNIDNITGKNCTQTEAAAIKDNCYPVASAIAFGLEIPMPSVDAFSERRMIYPASLDLLIKQQNSLGTAISNYSILDKSAKVMKTTKSFAATQLVSISN